MNKLKKVVHFLLIIGLLLPFLPLTYEADAATGTEKLYKTDKLKYVAAETDLWRNYKSVFYAGKTLELAPDKIDVGQGKKITKILLKKDGNTVLTIDNINNREYTLQLKDPLKGEAVPVKSVNNDPNGAWMAWQRPQWDSIWIAGQTSQYTVLESYPTPKEYVGFMNKDKWPGKKVLIYDIKFPRNQAYYAIGGVDYGVISTKYIDSTGETLLASNPFQAEVNVRTKWDRLVQAPQMITGAVPSGTTDRTTKLADFRVKNLNEAEIDFTQVYDHLGDKHQLFTEGQDMMYYFAFYEYDIKSFTYRYPNEYEVYYVEDDTPPPCQPGDPSCNPPVIPPPTGEFTCTDPAASGSPISGNVMDPAVSAVIRADQRGNEQFDVLQGIPTSETLFGNVFTRNYLFKDQFVNMKGTCTYQVPVSVTYVLSWDEAGVGPDGKPTTIPKTQTVPVHQLYTVVRPYSFWKIANLEVYKINNAVLSNYALPNGSITITPSGYNAPYYSASTGGNNYTPAPLVPVDLGTIPVKGQVPPVENFQAQAEKAIAKVQVKNDYLKFMEQVIMDNSMSIESTSAPGQIPSPTQVGNNVLYSPNNLISNSLANKRNTASYGKIYYDLLPNSINGGSDQMFTINGINTVTVHTPVVNYSVLPDSNRPFDQRMVPDMTRTVLILDRPFTINFTESGQHLNIPGYGNRDYRKYTLLKRVMFPFDTYSEDKSEFYPKNTWVSIPVGQASKSFKMPTWVTEGNYQIRTESWAVNSAGQNTCQQNYNGDLNNYCAVETFNVGVVGRLFGFRIWDIGDLRFEEVFRTSKGSANHTSVAYFSGGRNENGEPTTVYGKNSWILPVRSGSHPTYTANVPHNGYSFLFDFKTIGNVWDKGEGIRIEPTFWFVSRKGGTPFEVDLYYDVSGSKNKMIKVGSQKDTQTYTRVYQLADKLRNIQSSELSNAARYEYNSILSADQQAQQTWDKFYKQYLSRNVTIGAGYGIEILNYKARTLIGPTAIPQSVNATEALRSVQHWYGEYNIPIAPYILPKGTDVVALANKYGGKLDGHESEFLKQGYIVVNFGVYTLKNNDQNTKVLGYKAPIANMWSIEGQVTSSTDYLGRSFVHRFGDIIHFESDFSVRNDFNSNGG